MSVEQSQKEYAIQLCEAAKQVFSTILDTARRTDLGDLELLLIIDATAAGMLRTLMLAMPVLKPGTPLVTQEELARLD